MTVLTESRSGYAPTSRERAELVLGQLHQLPTLPALATRLLAVTVSGESNARDVVRIIESDASMTASVLKRVRRADLGIRADTITVDRAVTLLGFNAIRNLVFSLQLYGAFKDSGQESTSQDIFRELWRHNLAVACASELIAGYVDRSVQGQAFVCGLLHDIGKIAIDVCLPKSFARVVKTTEEQARCICDVEREALGLDHTIAGKHLAIRWNLPRSVIECIWLHHQDTESLPSNLVAPKLVRIVHLADELVRRDGIGFSGYQHVGDVEEQAHQLRLTLARMQKTVYHLPDRMRPICEMIGLDEPVDPEATAAALGVANSRLGQLNEKISETNRRLQIRSACLCAVEDFAKLLSVNDGICDIGRAAAQCIKTLVSADQALTIYHEESTQCLFVVPTQDPPDVQSLSSFQSAFSKSGMGMAWNRTDAKNGGISEAPVELEEVWQRYCSLGDGHCLYVLPLQVRDRCMGAVLFSASEDSVLQFTNARSECNILSTTFGLALASAGERAQAERTSEEFAELNRRYQAVQNERVRDRSVSMIAALAAGAAHELNNPLSVISGRTQMMLRESDCEDLQKTLKTVVDQTEKATGIVNELVAFAKPGTPVPQALNLCATVDRLCQRWQLELGPGIAEFAPSIADKETHLFVDPLHFQAILDKLVANSVEARGPDPLRVQINSPSRVSDETVRIVVKDNGVGMTREVLEHAIDPFFSSRPAGRGRGMGLSHAYRLAEVNGGRLWIDSKPQRGTAVTIELPTRAPAVEDVDAGERLQDSSG